MNAKGHSVVSNEQSATPTAAPTIPSAPGLTTATGGNNQVVLDWTTPSNDGNSAITGYDILRGTTPGGESATPIATVGTVLTYTDTTAVNGTQYYYEIEAVNAIGHSVVSNELSATPAAPTAPGAPDLTSATGGSSQVVLQWSAPSSDGGSVITGYDILRGTTPGGESATPIATVGNVLTYTDSTAVNGTEYYYEIEAVNAIGHSVVSNELSATPAAPTAPGAPDLTSATGGSSQVVLQWSAPSSDGGSVITGYDILRGTTPGGESATPIATVGNVLTYTDSTAVNGTEYYYEVEAVNAIGHSIASDEMSATPSAGGGGGGGGGGGPTEPGAPDLTTATGGNNQVVLDWTAPSSNGGSTITGYDILRGTTSGGESEIATVGNVLTYTDSTAVNGTEYYYEVEAVNSAGHSVASDQLSATPGNVPGAPDLTTATGGNNQVVLDWTAPTSDGGSAITGYDILRGTTSGGESATPIATVGTVLTYTDSTAVNGTEYYYEVEAVNSAGHSVASDELSATPAKRAKGTSHTSLTVSKSTFQYRAEHSVEFIVHVTTSGPGSKSGLVKIETGTRVLCQADVASDGVARCALPSRALGIGTYRVVAIYSGNSLFDGSTSASEKLRIVLR